MSDDALKPPGRIVLHCFAANGLDAAWTPYDESVWTCDEDVIYVRAPVLDEGLMRRGENARKMWSDPRYNGQMKANALYDALGLVLTALESNKGDRSP